MAGAPNLHTLMPLAVQMLGHTAWFDQYLDVVGLLDPPRSYGSALLPAQQSSGVSLVAFE